MNFRTVLAVILSILVMLIWSMYINRQALKITEKPEEQIVQKKVPIERISEPDVKKPIILVKEKEFKIETDKSIWTLTSRGARCKSIVLKDFQKSSNDKNFVELVESVTNIINFPLGLKLDSADELDWVDYQVQKLDEYNYKFIYITKGTEGRIPPGILITKNLKFFKDKYLIDFSLTLEKLPEDIKEVTLKLQPYIGPVNKKDIYNKIILIYFLEGRYKEIKSGAGCIAAKGVEPVSVNGNVDWIAIANRYFIISLIAKDRYKTRGAIFENPSQDEYEAGIINKLETKQVNKFDYLIYAGPKKRDLFKEYTKQFSELWSLEKTVGFNKFFSPIGNLLLDILIFFNKITKNYGISIILLTILIKIIFHPLTYSQYQSMAKIQKLQPIIENIKQQYKDNQQKMNQEIMALYKKYKVNPLGGCLPMLLQIPVFFAFYDMLMKSFELRNASFLWIEDLASPDTVGTIPGVGIPINILPVLMFITTIIQQKMTPVADKKSAQMMYLMPFIFLFIFWNLPSGLVLYWTVQNILTIFQQGIIKPGKNIKKEENNI